MVRPLGLVDLATEEARALALKPVAPAAVGVESRGAVRADDAQVREAVVVVDPVDVIEDQAHRLALPLLALAAELAAARFVALPEQTSFEAGAGVRRVLDEEARQWLRRLRRAARPSVWIEVLGRDPPDPDVLLQDRGRSASVAHAEVPERFGPRFRLRDGLPGLFLSVARPFPWHEHMFARPADGNDLEPKAGEPGFEPGPGGPRPPVLASYTTPQGQDRHCARLPSRG